MPDIKKTIEEYAAKFRLDYVALTSHQMKTQFNQPRGIMSHRAYSIVTLEKIAEEQIARRKTLLLSMFPTITDEQIASIKLEDEENDRGGLVIRPKEAVDG